MSFDARDVRRGMDVYSSDGVYLGTVIWVVDGPATPRPRPHAGQPDSAPRASPSQVSAAYSGESLGPMPTAALGNGGPRRQTAATDFASTPVFATNDPGRQPAEIVLLRMLTSLRWSTLRPRLRRIAVNEVQAVSLERIILSCTAAELDERRS